MFYYRILHLSHIFHRIWQKGSAHVHLCMWIYTYHSIKIFQNVEMSADVAHTNTRLRILDMLLTLVRVLIDMIRNQTAQQCRNM